MPSHIHYVEPFCGGCAVLLAHTGEGRGELINDLDGRLMNFWRVLQNPNQFAALLRRLEAVPLSRIEWTEAAARWCEKESVTGYPGVDALRCEQGGPARLHAHRRDRTGA